jgi:hypothetical protein
MACRRAALFLAAIAAHAAMPRRLHAQTYARLDLGGFIEAGGEAERYARVLQLAGLVPLAPWSIQPFSPSTVRALRPTGAHPWAARFADSARSDNDRFRALRPSARVIGNSAFPVQIGPGPTWAGRGLTAELQGGVEGHWGPLFAQAAPLFFATQNANFALASNGLTGDRQFADPRYPGDIDAPQRFGAHAFARLAPGTSSLVLDSHTIVLGFSTAPQKWGPNRDYPLVLGPSAGGFPELFAGNSQPWNLWLLRGQGRVVYGELSQSDYSPVRTGEQRRFGSGLVLVAQPRGLAGLEIGAARFLHRAWGDFSLQSLTRPFSGIVSVNGSGLNKGTENQTGSIFARWALPRARAEFYGEFYKEDYPGPFRVGTGSLVEQPDDYASFALGFQRLLTANAHTIRVLRGELVNGESSHQQRLERGFVIPIPPYIHFGVHQGHTSDGRILGSPEAYGGAAWRIGVDEYTPTGRRSLSIERQLRLDWLPTLAAGSGQVHPDVLYGIRAELLRFRGARDLGLTLLPAIDLNRNLESHHDVFSLTVALSARGWLLR